MIKKTIYISNLINIKNINGSEIREYDVPKPYSFNCIQQEGKSSLEQYGTKISKKYRAIIPNIYIGMFHEGDKVYLEGANPTDESINGANANYYIDNVNIISNKIILYFTRLQ